MAKSKKKVKEESQSFQLTGKHFLIGLGIIVLLLIYFAYGKHGLILNSNIVPTPTISIPNPTDTPVPTAIPTPVPTTSIQTNPKINSQIPATGEPMICYPAPQEGILHPMFCGTPNMNAPYWCNLQVYPPTYNPFPAFCGYKNQPNSVRPCLFNAVISYTPGGAVGYMSCN